MKDLFCGEIPGIFVKHLYAVPAILGAILYVFLRGINETAAAVIAAAVIVFLRLLAAKFKWNIPRA